MTIFVSFDGITVRANGERFWRFFSEVPMMNGTVSHDNRLARIHYSNATYRKMVVVVCRMGIYRYSHVTVRASVDGGKDELEVNGILDSSHVHFSGLDLCERFYVF